MQSKLAVIIGGTSGVGKHTAIDLANQNYHVIIVAVGLTKDDRLKPILVKQLAIRLSNWLWPI
nr:hypothetical protein [Lactiplantibacillus plantarum]